MIDAIRTRRSIRKFTGRCVPDEMIDAVLDAGRWAPSGMNNQPWRFAVVRDRDLRQDLGRCTKYGAVVNSADVIIAVFYNTSAGYDRTKDIQSIGACIQNMLLAAHDLGLGAVWLGEILRCSAEVKALLHAPEDHELMAAVAVGFPGGRPPGAPSRKPLSELVFFRK